MIPTGHNQEVGQTIRSITRRYYTVWWVYSFANGFLFGIYPLFLRSRGLNQFQINSVLASYFLVTFLTDIPTGAFADAISRRSAFVTGCALRCAAFTCYFFSHSYLLFLFAESIDGIGTTFCNGAIDAWAVDALDDAGFIGVKDRLFSRASQLMRIGFMGSALIGAHLAAIDLSWPWLLGAAGYAISLVIGSRLMREERRGRGEFSLAKLSGEVRKRMDIGVRLGLGTRPVLMLAIANAAQVAAWAPQWLEWPLYFNDRFGGHIIWIGWLFCFFSLAGLIGAEAGARLELSQSSRSNLIAAFVAAGSVAFFAAGFFNSHTYVVMGLFFLSNGLGGAMQPLISSWYNEQISSENRATMLSFQGTFATFGGSVGLLAGGRLADMYGLAFAWQFGGIFSLASAPMFRALRSREISVAAVVPEPAE